VKHPYLTGFIKGVVIAVLLHALDLRVIQYEWWVAMICLNVLTVPQIWGYLK